jgi:hypothetical protein
MTLGKASEAIELIGRCRKIPSRSDQDPGIECHIFETSPPRAPLWPEKADDWYTVAGRFTPPLFFVHKRYGASIFGRLGNGQKPMTKTIAIAAALLAAAPTLAVAQSLYTNDLNERPLYVPFYAPAVGRGWTRGGLPVPHPESSVGGQNETLAIGGEPPPRTF